MTPARPFPSLWSWQLRQLLVEAVWTGWLGALVLVGLRHLLDPDALVYRAGLLGAWALLPPVLVGVGLWLWWRHDAASRLASAVHAPGWLLGLWGLVNLGILAVAPKLGVPVFWVMPANALVWVAMVSLRPLRHPWALWLHLLPGWAVVGLVAALTFPGPDADAITRYLWPREVGFNALVLLLLGITANELRLAQRQRDSGEPPAQALARMRQHRHRVYAVCLGVSTLTLSVMQVGVNRLYGLPSPSAWIELGVTLSLAALLGRLLWQGRGLRRTQQVLSALAVGVVLPHLVTPMPGYSGLLALALMGVVAGHGPWRWPVLVWLAVMGLVKAAMTGDVPSLLGALLLPLVGSMALRLQALVDAHEQALTHAPASPTAAGALTSDDLTLPPAAQRSALTWAMVTGVLFVGAAMGLHGHLHPVADAREWAAHALTELPVVLLTGLALAALAHRSRLGFLSVELHREVVNQRDQLAWRERIEAAHRHAETTRAQTQAWLDRALADERAKSVFMASMSHQIRTPIQSLLGLAEVMALEPLTPEQHRTVSAAQRSTRALNHILNDVVDMTRLQHGELTLHPQPTALAPLCEDAVGLMRPNADAKGLALNLVWGPDLPTHAQLDGDRLRQVLLNLLGNAIKFTASGGVQLTVTLSHPVHAPSTPHLRMEVSDTGIGMPPSFLLRIAEPYAQADGSITRRFGGTGLGLSISQRLVQLMGGNGLQVTSQEHHGSTFTFELPWVAATLPDPTPLPPEADPASPDGDRPLQGAVIMLVDDNATNLEVTALLLEKLGAQVHLATGGTDLLDALDDHPVHYDAVLLDLYMPGMDGLACARRLRDDPRSATWPVVITSASAEPQEKVQAAAAGAVAFLTKPFDRAELMRTWINLKGRRA